MRYEIANEFSNEIEYRDFLENYCENGCVHHREDENGYAEIVEYGGCTIENALEGAKIGEAFPKVLVSVWDEDKCVNWCHCPFYREAEYFWDDY